MQQRSEDAVARLCALGERGQASGGMMLTLHALCQWIDLLLSEGREAQAARLLPMALGAARGGVVQPFQRLLELHPSWLREQLLHSQPARSRPNCWGACPNLRCPQAAPLRP